MDEMPQLSQEEYKDDQGEAFHGCQIFRKLQYYKIILSFHSFMMGARKSLP